MMRALITGASSGIGRDIARELSNRGYDLIIVARNVEALNQLKNEIKTDVKVIQKDLGTVENCKELYEEVVNEASEININNEFGIEEITPTPKREVNIRDMEKVINQPSYSDRIHIINE